MIVPVAVALTILVTSHVVPTVSTLVGGRMIVLGAPYFNRVVAPVLALLVLLSALGTTVPWRGARAIRVIRRLVPAAVGCVPAAGIAAVTSRSALFGLAAGLAITEIAMQALKRIVERHGGEVPRTLEELTALHGVGRVRAAVEPPVAADEAGPVSLQPGEELLADAGA